MLGKLLGALVGLTIGLALGSGLIATALVVVGVVIGHQADRGRADKQRYAEKPLPFSLPEPASKSDIDAQARAHFARSLCALFVEVARADGEVVRDEVRVVKAFFQHELGFTPLELEVVRLALKDALASPPSVEQVAQQHLELLPSERLLLLNALYELALADGGLRRVEGTVIDRIVDALGISAHDHRSIRAMHLGDGHTHYERLGLTADATDEQLKSAFRRLAATHHPDRVAHLGPGAVELASRRFREIKQAYDELRRIRGV